MGTGLTLTRLSVTRARAEKATHLYLPKALSKPVPGVSAMNHIIAIPLGAKSPGGWRMVRESEQRGGVNACVGIGPCP